MEGGVKTLLQGGSTKKKNKCRWEGEGGFVEEGVKTLLLRGSTQK